MSADKYILTVEPYLHPRGVPMDTATRFRHRLRLHGKMFAYDDIGHRVWPPTREHVEEARRYFWRHVGRHEEDGVYYLAVAAELGWLTAPLPDLVPEGPNEFSTGLEAPVRPWPRGGQ